MEMKTFCCLLCRKKEREEGNMKVIHNPETTNQDKPQQYTLMSMMHTDITERERKRGGNYTTVPVVLVVLNSRPVLEESLVV